jgi:hypothetical protein
LTNLGDPHWDKPLRGPPLVDHTLGTPFIDALGNPPYWTTLGRLGFLDTPCLTPIGGSNKLVPTMLDLSWGTPPFGKTPWWTPIRGTSLRNSLLGNPLGLSLWNHHWGPLLGGPIEDSIFGPACLTRLGDPPCGTPLADPHCGTTL